MKILLLTVGTVNYNCDINFFEPLKDLGYSVLRYNYLEKLNLIGKKRMNKEILKLARSEKPDYIFHITYRDEISLKTLKKLNQEGNKVVGWFSDDHWRFDNYSKFLAKNLFCSITTSPDAFIKYKEKNLNVIKSQWASNPKYYHPVPADEKYDVSFVGQKYGPREEILGYLRSNNISIDIFGRGWDVYVPFEKVISIFSNSKININISASSLDPKIKQIKGRIFEVPMCGGFLLTDYVYGLEEYFDIGKEIVCYEDKKDLVHKIKYYLKNEFERKKIAKKGYHAALKRNTWSKRFNDIFKELGDIHYKKAQSEGLFGKIKKVLSKQL
jgi:spore maturation protein CgeB